MNKMLTATMCALLVGSTLAVTRTDALAQSAQVQHPYIYNGYSLLSRARYVLNHGKHEFGGHRTAAINHIDQAIAELKLAIAADHGTPPAQIYQSGTPTMSRGQRHPYMHDGLKLCQEAKAELEKGTHAFGGHRVAALQHVDQAIAELQQAAQYPVHE
jgi:hypothetical protein